MKGSWAALALFILVLGTHHARAAETPAYGGRLVYGVRNDLTALNPFIRMQSGNFYIRGIIDDAVGL